MTPSSGESTSEVYGRAAEPLPTGVNVPVRRRRYGKDPYGKEESSAPRPATGGLRKRTHCIHDGAPRRKALAEAYRHTAAAAARFRLSARPWIGTRTFASASSASSAGSP